MTAPLDILAVGAHRDDVELTCGGTLIKHAQRGLRTGILDLTQGEMGTRGSAEIRAAEAEAAAEVMGVAVRRNLGLPDAHIENSAETRLRLGKVIRELRPRIVIAPAQQGRHPDHRIASELIRDACFLAGLSKYDSSLPPHRPTKLIYAIAYREDHIKPSFVVDISSTFEAKMQAIKCYASQFDNAVQAGEIFPTGESLYDLVRHKNAHYGSLIRCGYGEPFLTLETMRVDDMLALEVSTF